MTGEFGKCCMLLDASGDRNEFVNLADWTHTGNHAFQRSCVTSDSDVAEIRVALRGQYVFYNHLAVCRCAGDVQFRQRVYRRPSNAGAAKILLENSSLGRSRGEGEDCVGEPAFSSDLFAVIRLEANDSVWIAAKPASAVYRPNGASFFGLYRLSD